MRQVRVLFVCLGNICRSPMAEAILRDRAANGPLNSWVDVDSAGTGDWHLGEWPDPRTQNVCRSRGIEEFSRARQVSSADFGEFDLIIAMDRSNRTNLHRWSGSDPTKVRLMREWIGEPDTDVPDPYYGDLAGFESGFDLLSRCIDSLEQDLLDRTGLSGKISPNG